MTNNFLRTQNGDAIALSTRLRAVLQASHWSVRLLASLIDRDERTIRHWLSGRYDPPPDVLAWLEAVAAFHAQHPPPVKQRRKADVVTAPGAL